MPRRRLTPGAWGWIGLVAWITGYDLLAAETLSIAFWRAVQCRYRRPVVVVLWTFITAHLFHLLPERADPLRRLDAALRPRRRPSWMLSSHASEVDDCR